MSKKIFLPGLQIKLPVSDDFEFFDCGFTDTYNFYNAIWNKRYGRDLRMLEISQLGIGSLNEAYGEYYAYKRRNSDEKPTYVYMFIHEAVRENSALVAFLRGHEETHILQPNITDRFDLLNEKLLELEGKKQLETNPPESDYDLIADIGGLVAMQIAGISVRQATDSQWQKFLKGFERNSGIQFQTALDFLKLV